MHHLHHHILISSSSPTPSYDEASATSWPTLRHHHGWSEPTREQTDLFRHLTFIIARRLVATEEARALRLQLTQLIATISVAPVLAHGGSSDSDRGSGGGSEGNATARREQQWHTRLDALEAKMNECMSRATYTWMLVHTNQVRDLNLVS